MKSFALLGPALAASLLCGCSTPREPVATATLQTRWSGDDAMNGTGAASTSAAWWQAFHDPALDALIERAQTRNLDLRIAEATVAEVRALRGGSTAALLPQINAGVDVTRNRTLRFGDVMTTATASLAASWELDLFGRLRNERRAAIADQQAAESDRDAVRLLLLAEVARGYLDYRLYGLQQQLVEKTAQAQVETLRITRARYEQGLGSRLDLERASALLATTRAQIPQMRELHASAFHRLVLLTAATPESLQPLLPAVTAETPLPDSELLPLLAMPTQVLAQRPDVRAAERRMLGASARLAASRALRYPQLNLSALIGLSGNDLGRVFDDGTRTWSAGGSLLAPLFDFGRIRTVIDAANAREEQAFLQYERTVRTALQEAQTALIFYTEGKLRQRELQNAVDAARKAAQLARRQYGEGALGLLEVLDAERSLYDAELAWSQATGAVSTRLVTLYQTMGVVPPRDSAVALAESATAR